MDSIFSLCIDSTNNVAGAELGPHAKLSAGVTALCYIDGFTALGTVSYHFHAPFPNAILHQITFVHPCSSP